MSIITPQLYLGSDKEAKDLNFLKKHKIVLIVNCAQEIPNYFKDKFTYWNLNLQDVPNQDLSHVLDKVADQIIKIMQQGKTVFVHCAAGISRSSTIVIYTLMKKHNWDFENAYTFVKEMHPNTSPNPGFIQQLVNAQKALGHQPNLHLTQQTSESQQFQENIPLERYNASQNRDPELQRNYQHEGSRSHRAPLDYNNQDSGFPKELPSKGARIPEHRNQNVNDISDSYEHRIQRHPSLQHFSGREIPQHNRNVPVQSDFQQYDDQQFSLEDPRQFHQPPQREMHGDSQQQRVQQPSQRTVHRPQFQGNNKEFDTPLPQLPNENGDGKVWSSLTFDSTNDERPYFASNGKGLYARIFS